jgi:hypothetical protein
VTTRAQRSVGSKHAGGAPACYRTLVRYCGDRSTDADLSEACFNVTANRPTPVRPNNDYTER